MSHSISDRFGGLRIEGNDGWGTPEDDDSSNTATGSTLSAPTASRRGEEQRNSRQEEQQNSRQQPREQDPRPQYSQRSPPSQQQDSSYRVESLGWGEEEPQQQQQQQAPVERQDGRRGGRNRSESAGGGWGDELGEPSQAPSLEGRSSGHLAPVNEAATRQVVDGLIDSLQNVNVKLADKQADVNSPLYSAKSFEQLGLSDELLKGIYAMKFVKPSKVQERALPLLLADPPQNMIAQSQSGTGKTAAFVLTMLKRVDLNNPNPQAICLAPTRELARQTLDVVQKMGQFTGVTSAMVLREEAPRRDPIMAQVLVGTPGTLLEMERRRLVDLSGVRVFVLDEADVMLDKQGMGLQSMRLRKLCPAECQLLLFSATFNEGVIEFAHMIIPTANEITLRREEVSVESIKQFYIECDSYPHKIEMLSMIYGLLTIGQSIVFIATRNSAEEVRQRMVSEGHLVSLIHGAMAPQERDEVIDEFRQGRTKVLLATNVLARGIDVLQVSLVVNFDLPMTPERYPDPETYVHRIGRTGRFGRSGVAINFVHNELSRCTLKALEEFFGREIVRMPTESIELLEQRLQSINRGHTALETPADVPKNL